MNSGKIRAALALCLLAAALAPAARADTVHDLEKQAGTRWRETITAHGRTLDFDVAAEVPPVEVGIHRHRQPPFPRGAFLWRLFRAASLYLEARRIKTCHDNKKNIK